MLLIAYAVFGLIIGSFLTVCIYRIPLSRIEAAESSRGEGEDPDSDERSAPLLQPDTKRPLTFSYPPRSICLACKQQLKWWHNIPLISWIILGGRCAYCKAGIPFRYPLVEFLTAAVSVLSFYQFGLTLTAFLIFAFVSALIVISFIDYDYYIIPNVISLPGLTAGVVVAVVNQFVPLFDPPVVQSIADSIIGILVGGGFLLLISEGYLRLRKKEGLGMGDVKLLAMTGAFFWF